MSGSRILFADDSQTIRQVFEIAFEGEDMEVILAGDGREAFEKIKEHPPDIVIADVNMPQMDGFELCHSIKNDPYCSGVLVYLLSSSLEEFDEARAAEVGADGKFDKPFKAEEIVDKVRKAFSCITQGDANDEDTFDNFDISIDGILDAVAMPEDVEPLDVAEMIMADETVAKAVELIREEANDVQAQEVSHVGIPDLEEPEHLNMSATTFLDLGADTLLEDELSDEDDEEMAEVISDMDGEEIEEDVSIDGFAETQTDFVDDFSDISDTGPLETLDVFAKPDEEADKKQGARLIDELDDVADQEDKEAQMALKENVMETPVDEYAGEQDVVERALEAAGPGIEEAMRNVIAEKLSGGKLEMAINNQINVVLAEMKPEILKMFEKVAKDMTLLVAEDMVKQTIEQIKDDG